MEIEIQQFGLYTPITGDAQLDTYIEQLNIIIKELLETQLDLEERIEILEEGA